MNDNNIDRMKELIDLINNYSYHYYVLDNPLISDADWDQLYDELHHLEMSSNIIMPDSPSQRVGGEPITAFGTHVHRNRLLSLDKVNNYDELKAWDTRVRRLCEEYEKRTNDSLPSLEYTIEYKFDGLTINLTFDSGSLVQAATRGNGKVGEIILEQVKTIKSIPLTISFQGKMEVQGEGIIRLSVLEQYNKTTVDPLKNARNGVAGAIRNLDPKITASRKLDAFFYNIGYFSGNELHNQLDTISFLEENHFPVSKCLGLFTSIQTVAEEITKIEKVRNHLDFLIDGIVIKINDFKTRTILGYTDKFPRWAIAFKYEAVEIITTVENISWDVGRTGKLTPLASVMPVEIGGATVRKATLNNWGDIQRKKITIGSKVWIRRSNDVIPEITHCVDEENYRNQPIKKPDKCPACMSILLEKGAHLFCENSLSCKPQLISRIVHYSSKDGMNIDAFNKKTAEILFDKLNIKEISGLYDLKMADLIELNRFGAKKAQNLLDTINKSKNCQLDHFINALGIPNVGKKTAQDIAQHYKSFEQFLKASYADLLLIPDVGDIVANSIIKFISDKMIRESIDNLLRLGVSPSFQTESIQMQSPIQGKIFVLTGKLMDYSRNDITEMIEKKGGVVSESVSNKTDYLIFGENPGSKYTKAMQLGTKIITGVDFFTLFITNHD